MTKRWFIRACLAGMLGLFTAAIAFAVPSIVLERRGGSYTIFDIRAYNLENVGAIELLINYDRAAFKNPSISWGDFILPHYHMGNTNFAPGQVKMAIASITGINASSGVLATLTFEPNVNPAAGTVTWGMTPSVISTNAETLGSSGLVPNPPPVTSTTSDTGTTAPSTSATTSTSTGTTSGTTTSTSAGTSTAGTSGTGLGTVTISTLDTSAPPVGQTAPEFSESLTTSSGTGAGTSTEGTAAATGDGRTPSAGEGRDVGGAARDSSVERAALKAAQNIKDQEKFASYRGVLQAFRDFTGERTPKSLMELFKTVNIPGFTQTPAIALADGKATVTLTVRLPAAGKAAPNFALAKARLISLKKNSEGDWLIEARPEKGAQQSVLTVIQEDSVLEYPLTIAPPADVKVDTAKPVVSEADFLLFLKERGDAKAPKHDLNKDGKRDYIDDYIYTANYLVATSSTKAPVKK